MIFETEDGRLVDEAELIEEPMSDSELLALCDAAMPGPWFVSRDPRPNMEWNNHIARAAAPHIEVCSMFHTNDVDDNETGEANARFIAAARAAIPRLLAEKEKLVLELERVTEYSNDAVAGATDAEG